MFQMYDVGRALPVRIAGFPYGVGLALPPFLGAGLFNVGSGEPVSEDDMAQDRWAADGGPVGED